jgi:hypothetical protein
MKRYFYFALHILITLSATSCEKQSIPETTILSAPTCMVVGITTKELLNEKRPGIDGERIAVGSQTFEVSLSKKSSFSYDSQGRIVTEYHQYSSLDADSIYYQYFAGVIKVRRIEKTGPQTLQYNETIELNEKGYALQRPDTYKATYDANGYIKSLINEYGTAKIIDGNITELLVVDSPSTPRYLIKNKYDLSKAGLPPIQTFYGIESRNLLVNTIVDKDDQYTITPAVYSSDFSYTFDNKGRITRQIQYGKDGLIPYIYGGTSVKVNDFTYQCPPIK